MNSLCIGGRLTAAPQFTEHDNDVKRCVFFIANDVWYGGEKSTGFYRVKAWGRTAELTRDLLATGDEVFVTGRLEQQRYENETGAMIYDTSIVLESFTKARSASPEAKV